MTAKKPTKQTQEQEQSPQEQNSSLGEVAAPEIEEIAALDYPEPDHESADPHAPKLEGEDLDTCEDIGTPIDRKAFRHTLSALLSMPGSFSEDWKPLAVQSGEQDALNEAADGIYDLLQIWFPSFLMPENATLQAFTRAAPLIMMKAMVVREVLAARNAKQIKQPKEDANSVAMAS